MTEGGAFSALPRVGLSSCPLSPPHTDAHGDFCLGCRESLASPNSSVVSRVSPLKESTRLLRRYALPT